MGQAHTRIVVGLAVIGLVAGCRTSTQIKDVARTDLEVANSGNRGYFVGTPPPPSAMRTTREILELNIEIPHLFNLPAGTDTDGAEEAAPARAVAPAPPAPQMPDTAMDAPMDLQPEMAPEAPQDDGEPAAAPTPYKK